MVKTAVITGATSGIGMAYARRLAGDGYNLVLTGRRKEVIQNLADELVSRYKVKVTTLIAELSDDSDIQKVIDSINNSENVEMLVNNAGYSGSPKCFDEGSLADYEQMVKVLSVAPMRLVYAVIPHMTKQGKGAIINISSIGGIAPFPKNPVYCGNKAFMKLFSEALYLEFKNKGIKVQVVCPGYVVTDFYRDYSEKQKRVFTKGAPALTSDAVAEYSLRCLKRNQAVCIPGASYRLLYGLLSILPRSVWYRWSKSFTPSS